MKNIIIFICIGICSFCSFSQIRVGFDGDCLLGNSAILSDAMISCFGEDSVKHWIDNNINITFIVSIDSTGRTQKINRIWTKKAFSLDLVQSIEDYLIANDTHFSVCYFKDPPDVTEEFIVNGVREDFMEKRYKSIAVGFPGSLLSSYSLKKEEFMEKGICLSKFEYLIMRIKNFNCTSSHKDFVKNEAIIPFLEEISIDTFYLNEAYYPGVIYLFARNVNDTSFIQTLPSECVFEKSDLQHAFCWKGTLFLCKGDEDIFELLFDFSNNQIENSSTHSWKFCEEIGDPNDYDPKTISLVICGKEVEKVSLSDKMRDFIISGVLPPPPPADHQNSDILPIADM